MQTNPQLQLAYDFVEHTNKNVFLTGKAGTGKTTFLHNLKKNSPKKFITVAPTGVAAINAGGVTIHSFFQLPFGPYIPGSMAGNSSYSKKFRSEKIRLIRNIDLLVIDEISMVRADVLDGIDEVLRKYRDRNLPFGGLQLLMIGDLHQLSPIVKEDELNILKPFYETVYFFGSRALQQSAPVTIELKQIFRQQDDYFIGLLNKVRQNQLDHHTLLELNERYQPDFAPDLNDDYITLTSHNATAQNINQDKLNRLEDTLRTFKATVKGDFPEYAYPTEMELQLKVNAQVMFVKNDPSRDKLFYNGKIGRIISIGKEEITVQCKGDNFSISVKPLEWQNLKYVLGSDNNIKEEIIGSFTQLPLKLAWAITIHKSQGLTFERAIIDAQSSFAHGQVYVALSRCKTFEGMILRTPIHESSVKTDERIKYFTREIENNIPDAGYLLNEKKNFQVNLLNELFDFSEIKKNLFFSQKSVQENISIIDPLLWEDINKVKEIFINDILAVGAKFSIELNQLLAAGQLPEDHTQLQERVKKAASYFLLKLNSLYKEIRKFVVDTDNQAARKVIVDDLKQLQFAVFEKRYGQQTALKGFNAIAYIQAKNVSELNFEKESQSFSPVKKQDELSSDKDSLKDILRTWRNRKAKELNTDVYMVISRKAMDDLAEKMPTTSKELLKVNGIGKKKVDRFGAEILEIIGTYCRDNNLTRSILTDDLPGEDRQKEAGTKKVKGETQRISLEMFKDGKTIQEIAAERNITTGTVESHLGSFIGTGEIDILKLLPGEKLELIKNYLEKNPGIPLTVAKNELGNDISFSEIRFVMNYIPALKQTAPL